MKLPENLRDRFKEPLGRLIPDSKATKEIILGEIRKALVITVGDVTTKKITDYGIVPAVQIVDGKTRRAQFPIKEPDEPIVVVKCDNPAGGITPECVRIIEEAVRSEMPVQVRVTGEEDLLVIPACMHAPKGSVVMYGQPDEGLVVVHIDETVKNKTRALLSMMK